MSDLRPGCCLAPRAVFDTAAHIHENPVDQVHLPEMPAFCVSGPEITVITGKHIHITHESPSAGD
jgi:hypothetical protein